jgi:hypothetical protein
MMKRACPICMYLSRIFCSPPRVGGQRDQSAEPKVKVGDDTFKCITDMTPVRHFYVGNLLGNLQELFFDPAISWKQRVGSRGHCHLMVSLLS